MVGALSFSGSWRSIMLQNFDAVNLVRYKLVNSASNVVVST